MFRAGDAALVRLVRRVPAVRDSGGHPADGRPGGYCSLVSGVPNTEAGVPPHYTSVVRPTLSREC